MDRPNVRVVLARHGQTVSNRNGFIMGRSDSLLTAEGIDMVRSMARLVSDYRPAQIFASSLGRASYTAAIYSEILEIPVQFSPDIVELGCGEWEGRKRALVNPGDRPMRSTWLDRPPGGESCQDAEERVASFIRRIRSVTADHPVLVVSHASVSRVFLKLWLNLEPSEAISIEFPHEVIYLLAESSVVSHVFAGRGETKGLLLA